MELQLDRKIANKRIYPAVDLDLLPVHVEMICYSTK
jgi:transcription termination factor Rho